MEETNEPCEFEVPRDGTDWEAILPLEEPDGELVFKTDIADKPFEPWWKILPTTLYSGAAIGFCMWYLFDHQVSTPRLILWPMCMSIFFSILMLPCFRKNELREFRISASGLRIITNGNNCFYALKDLEAARFEFYPETLFGAVIPCFLFRVDGKNREIGISGIPKVNFEVFCLVLQNYLEVHQIPDQTKGFRSFQYSLSLIGACLFGAGWIVVTIAHLLVFHTLGMIVGVSVMTSGIIIAIMTRKERISKWIIAVTLFLAAAAFIMFQVFDIDVRQKLLEWEYRERDLGRPPWGQQTEAP